jgi:hypothetical protein
MAPIASDGACIIGDYSLSVHLDFCSILEHRYHFLLSKIN